MISTSGVYRSSCVGNCYDLAWTEASEIVAKNGSNVILFKNLAEYKSFKPGFAFDQVYAGTYMYLNTIYFLIKILKTLSIKYKKVFDYL